MTKHTTSLLIALFVFTVSVVAAPQGNDIEGVVTVAGFSTPIPGVLVTLSSSPMDPLSMRALQISARLAGVNFSPSTAQGEEMMFQSLTYAALSAGVSPGSGDLMTALHNFREQTAKFKGITASDGRFAIPNVPPGQYTIRAERDGFFGARNSAATISFPGSRAPLSLSLTPGATIGGRLRDDDGEFLPNATVEAFAVTYANGYPTLSPAVVAKTNFRGEYRLFWMKAGDYIIAATRDGIVELGARTFYPGSPELKNAMTVALKTGDNIEGVDFTLADARLAIISGEIISQLPPPDLANVGLPPGVELPKDFVPPVELYVVPRDSNSPVTTNSSLVTAVVLESNRGTFEFKAPPGAYDVYAQTFPRGATRVPLDVGNQDIVGMTLNIQPPIPVKGTINTNGVMVDVTKLRLITAMVGNSPIGGASVINPGAILPDGAFSATVPVEGRYQPNIPGLPPGSYISDVRQNGASVFDSGFSAFANAAPIEIVLGSGLGVVKGAVLDAAGKPVSNAVVSIVPMEGRRENRTLYRANNSNGSGQFSIPAVIPGNYKVFAWLGVPNGSYMNQTFLARYEDKGKPVTVDASGNVDVSLIVANEP